MLTATKYVLILIITLSLWSCNDQASSGEATERIVAQTFHSKDIVATETSLTADGKKDGPYKEYFPNGSLQAEKHFRDDELIAQKLYTIDGKVIQNIVYKDGRKYGLLFSSFCMNGVAKSGEKDSLIFNPKN